MKETKNTPAGGSGGAPRRSSRTWFYALGGLVVLFVAITAAWPSAQPEPQSVQAPITGAERIDVVYFHRTERCVSCQWAGDITRKTVETYFKADLASGRLTFREVDVQQKTNAALASKYRAGGSALYLNYVKNGVDNIRQASDTYPYIGNEARFTALLRAKIAAGLGQGG
ncbi:MAG: nitrophenyl compound nitroreductase subunit ArsF family protein [Chloroflexota bacterium]